SVSPPGAVRLVDLRVAALGQNAGDRGVKAALPSLGLEPLALQAERAAAARSRRYGEIDRAGKRRHAHLGAEHRFVERHRQFDAQVAAVAVEHRVRAIVTEIRTSHAPPGPGSPCPRSRICWPSSRPAGIFTSTSLPLGRCTRFVVPLAASGSVMVSDAWMSRLGAGPKSFGSNDPPKPPRALRA